MKTIDKLEILAKKKDNLKKLLTLLDKSVTILSAIEVNSPKYTKDISKIIDEFDKLVDWK